MDRSSARNSFAAPVRVATNPSLPPPATALNPPTLAFKANMPQTPPAPPPENTIKEVILDYLLYVSTHARLTQADQEELKGASGDRPRPSQGVEAIVEGLLQSHRTQADAVLLPTPLKYRLYLCALTNSIFNRSNPTAYLSATNLQAARQGALATNLTATSSSSSSSIASNLYNQTTVNLSPHKPRAHSAHPTLSKFERFFKNAVSPPRCRRHRLKVCGSCHNHQGRTNASFRKVSNPTVGRPSRQQSGLFDAIPAFIHTSVLAYRQGELRDNNGRIASEWYKLLLDLLTQATIECYLCDSHTSMDSLLEIFSYGDVDPSEYHPEDMEEDEDDHLLWQHSPSLDEFRSHKLQRREEFLNVKGGIEKHFETLAKKYPVQDFEDAMREYCSKVMTSMKSPEMFKFRTKTAMNDQPLSELLEIPGQNRNGIAIPVSDDEDDDDNDNQTTPMAHDEPERCATRRSNDSMRSDEDFADVVPMQVSTPPKRAADGEDDENGERRWQFNKKRRDGASSS